MYRQQNKCGQNKYSNKPEAEYYRRRCCVLKTYPSQITWSALHKKETCKLESPQVFITYANFRVL